MHRPYAPSRKPSVSIALALAILLSASPARPQTPKPDARHTMGTISGTIVDDTGTAVVGARVTLTRDGDATGMDVRVNAKGVFSFSKVPPGPFHLTVSAPGFSRQTVSGDLASGGVSTLPPIRMTVAAGSMIVDVTPTRAEVAEHQIKEEEQQRVLGFVPNFFVSYNPDAVPLSTKQKFELSWKSRLDPVQFGVVALFAGVQQARNDFSAFGPGLGGYGKRYAAAYATFLTRGLITQVLLPSVFKQDPRYFYRGTGSTASRIGYAVSRTVIRKGDNGHWQPNYSGILGSLAAGGLSNLYYPAQNRKGVSLTLENAAIGLGGGALGHLAQEFLFKKWTSHR